MSVGISILMGIYNCEKTLNEAVDSVLAQTEEDWELILCDDGSCDQTLTIAREYAKQYPGKIRLLENGKNLGLQKTLNRCLDAAEGHYIARMDGDDISLPERLEKERRFLDDHPEITLVSCPMHYFDDTGIWKTGTATAFPQPEDFVDGTPFCHAPCMVRADALRAVKGYREEPWVTRAEDYDLWFRMYAAGCRGANLAEPLYMMRDDENAYRRRTFSNALNEARVRFCGYRMLGLGLTSYLYVLRPLLVKMLPRPLYLYLHHKKSK